MTAMNSMRVLVVDDEPDAAEALTLLLKPRGFDVRVAGTGDEARAEVTAWRPHVVLLDLMLPDVNGLDLLRDFRAVVPDTQVVMVTGYGSVPKVVEAMNGGAFGFIEKPIDAMLLLAVLDKATEKLALAAENRRLRSELHDHATLDDMVARSDKMKQLFTLVRKVAPSDASVLIVGENGTGKELVASALHQNSKRAKGPFIKINCAAIPSELIESELFGHKRGSFTGALADRPGVIELADGGSLLLDEIGEMPAALQAKLLRVLQEREFTPVGSTRPIKSDFRLICSTNLNLDAALADKKLRQDLYFRINTFTLAIPRVARAHHGHPAAGRVLPRADTRRGISGRSPASILTRRACCSGTGGQATCASWSTPSSARSSSPPRRRSRSRTCRPRCAMPSPTWDATTRFPRITRSRRSSGWRFCARSSGRSGTSARRPPFSASTGRRCTAS